MPIWNLTVSNSYAYAVTVYDVAVGQRPVAPRDPPYAVPKPLGNVVVTGFGQAMLGGNGGFSKIDLASFVLPGQETDSPEG